MKKLFVAVVLMLGVWAANGQEAFKHLSLGLEVGLTGPGLQIAVPVVSDHLVLVAGYNFPNIKVGVNPNVDISAFSNEMNSYINRAQPVISAVDPGETLQKMPGSTKVHTDATANFSAFKAMLEYYPTVKSSFHITAGVFLAGSENLMSATLSADEIWGIYQYDSEIVNSPGIRQALIAAGVEGSMPEARFAADGHSYKINDGTLDAGFKVSKVRPYLGIGFGRTFPRQNHFAFQFDLGALYCGKLSATSKNEVAFSPEDPSLKVDMSKLTSCPVMPNIQFRLIYKIF